MSDVFMVLPPNVVRRTDSEVNRLFPAVQLRPHHTHGEMDRYFSLEFGRPEFTADLTVSAYPQALAAAAASDIFAPRPGDLPPLRPELARAGLGDAPPEVIIIGVVAVIFIHHLGLTSPPRAWGDLTKDEYLGKVVTPPHDTPMPALFRHYLEAHYGQRGAAAADALHAELYPLDINKAVDEGRYAVGMAIPAFGRTFRNASARMVWPAEGAVAVPVMAFLRRDASPDARRVLDYLLSDPYQDYLSTTGLICPAVASAPPFDELKENQWRLLYSGWEAYARVGGQLAQAVHSQKLAVTT